MPVMSYYHRRLPHHTGTQKPCSNARLAEPSLVRAHLKNHMRLTRLGLLVLFSVAAYAADICGRNDLYGPYGFQYAGTTTISGAETPVAGIGRIEFGDDGAVSGISSV